MNTDIANQALHLAMEWGEYFMKPTQPRLKALHRRLTKSSSTATTRWPAVMTLAYRYLDDRPDCDFQNLATAVQPQHPWVSADNLARLYTQGMYYAHK